MDTNNIRKIRSVMYVSVLPLVLVVLCSLPLDTYAFPITTTETISDFRVSQYEDGYQINGSGTVFTLYSQKQADGTWGSWQDLLLDAATVRTLLDQQQIQLAGYNNNTNQWEYCTGIGSSDTLDTHTTNYGWNFNYTISFDGFGVGIDLQLGFDWSYTSFTVQEQQQQMAIWESGIENWWNKQYVIVKDGGKYIFDIVFDITFDGYDDGNGGTRFDQTVTVLPGNGRANMVTWYLEDSTQTNAHEFGHMLGLYDEYWGGALDPNTLEVDYDHLMGGLGGMKSSYYESFMTWLDGIDPDPTQWYELRVWDDSFGQVPEPGTLFLLGLGLLGVIGLKRRSLKKQHR